MLDMPVSPSGAETYELPDVVEPSSSEVYGEDDDPSTESAQLLQAKAITTVDVDEPQGQRVSGESQFNGEESRIEALIARVRIFTRPFVKPV